MLVDFRICSTLLREVDEKKNFWMSAVPLNYTSLLAPRHYFASLYHIPAQSHGKSSSIKLALTCYCGNCATWRENLYFLQALRVSFSFDIGDCLFPLQYKYISLDRQNTLVGKTAAVLVCSSWQ